MITMITPIIHFCWKTMVICYLLILIVWFIFGSWYKLLCNVILDINKEQRLLWRKLKQSLVSSFGLNFTFVTWSAIFIQLFHQRTIKQMVKLDTHSNASWVIFYFIQTHFFPSETILEFLKTKTILLLSFCMAYTGKDITKGNSH